MFHGEAVQFSHFHEPMGGLLDIVSQDEFSVRVDEIEQENKNGDVQQIPFFKPKCLDNRLLKVRLPCSVRSVLKSTISDASVCSACVGLNLAVL